MFAHNRIPEPRRAIAPGSGTAARVKLPERDDPVWLKLISTSAAVALAPGSPGPGKYVPVKVTSRKLLLWWTMVPPDAMKLPYVGFEMEKPPPVDTVRSLRLMGPKAVRNGTTEKSPVPEPEVTARTANSIVLLARLGPFSVALKTTKGKEPEIALACITPLPATNSTRTANTGKRRTFFMTTPSNRLPIQSHVSGDVGLHPGETKFSDTTCSHLPASNAPKKLFTYSS